MDRSLERRASMPSRSCSSSSAAAHNGVRTKKDEKPHPSRAAPTGSENWDPSTLGASSRPTHARSFSASALTPITWIVNGLGLSGFKSEAEDKQKAAMSAKPEDVVANSADRSSASPSFDATEAHARCCRNDGYVSFSDIEGLGQPPASPDRKGPAPGRLIEEGCSECSIQGFSFIQLDLS
ncbi:hypothetical protein B0H14DRAFT_2917019 [Mycena olivaceomarginata]|nr:hypothetical protein B0H14DRAFT_2917019 [Mycena olivaceomarginata]